MSESGERLETPKQLAARIGLTERQVRHLIQTRQIEHVMIGCRVLIPVGAFAKFLETKKVRPCPDATKDHDSVGSKSALASMSSGPNAAAAASAQLARRTANRLKSFSRNGCNAEDAAPAQVIPLKSS
jgi:excisionase family DNA binding protein